MLPLVRKMESLHTKSPKKLIFVRLLKTIIKSNIKKQCPKAPKQFVSMCLILPSPFTSSRLKIFFAFETAVSFESSHDKVLCMKSFLTFSIPSNSKRFTTISVISAISMVPADKYDGALESHF